MSAAESGPLDVFKKIDPELFKVVQDTRDFALKDGALPRKYKCLIAMALDAAAGAVNGTKKLAEEAMKAGATREEVTEALRCAQYISGVGSIYTAGRGLQELF